MNTTRSKTKANANSGTLSLRINPSITTNSSPADRFSAFQKECHNSIYVYNTPNCKKPHWNDRQKPFRFLPIVYTSTIEHFRLPMGTYQGSSASKSTAHDMWEHSMNSLIISSKFLFINKCQPAPCRNLSFHMCFSLLIMVVSTASPVVL